MGRDKSTDIQIEAKVQYIKEHRIHVLPSGEKIVVFYKSNLPLSWLKLNPDELLLSYTLDKALINSNWFKKRIGQANSVNAEFTLVVKPDKTDFVAIETDTLSLHSGSKKYNLSKIEDDEQDTQLLRQQKKIVRNNLSNIVRTRIFSSLEAHGTESAGVVKLCTLDNSKDIYLIQVDAELEPLLQIDGDENSEDQQYKPSNKKVLDSKTRRISLQKKGEALIVQTDGNGGFTYLSSNFGRTPVVASSAMELPIGRKRESLANLINTSIANNKVPEAEISKVRQQTREHLVKLILKRKQGASGNLESTQDTTLSLYNPVTLRESRLSRLPIKLQEAIMGSWYSQKISENKSLFGNEPVLDSVGYKATRTYPEELIEFLLNNPSLDLLEALAEYKLLTVDLQPFVNHQIKQAGLEYFGSEVDSRLGSIYLNIFETISKYDLEDIIKISEKFPQDVRSGIRLHIKQLFEKPGNLETKKHSLSRYLASVIFDLIVMKLGKIHFSKVTDTNIRLDHDQIIDDTIIQLSKKHEQYTAAQQTRLLMNTITESQSVAIGEITVNRDVLSTEGPFQVLPEYTTEYPIVVIEALKFLYAEYNRAFGTLIEQNREWDTDYQYCFTKDGDPINRWVQIDMRGLPQKFLETAKYMKVDEVVEVLRHSIFEIENSLAMYQLLEKIFQKDDSDTNFKKQFRDSLNKLRKQTGKKIALLAVTQQKYQAMKESEFGKTGNDKLLSSEVYELSGFDEFFGPEDFQEYLKNNKGECDFLLYVRSSDPLTKLIDPAAKVEVPLLTDDRLRRTIKANAITFNIDNPELKTGDTRRINDTKEYLGPMKMGFHLNTIDQLFSSDFTQFLVESGANPVLIKHGCVQLRAKPRQGTYGCYGHHRGTLNNRVFRKNVESELKKRGPYVIQIEMSFPTLIDIDTLRPYSFIDRNFFCTDGELYNFMSGFRSIMPNDAKELAQGRIHGADETLWAEICDTTTLK